MSVSSGLFEVCLEGLPVLEHGPEDVDASAREGDEGLVVAFSFSPFAIIEGAAVGGVQRAEGGLIEDALQGLIAAGRSLEKADLTGLPQHRSEPGRRGQGIGGAEALEVACLGDQLGGEHGPMPGRLRMRALSGWRATRVSSSLSSSAMRLRMLSASTRPA